MARLALVLTACAARAVTAFSVPTAGDPESRAKKIVEQMSLNDKIMMLAGHRSEDADYGNYIGRVGSDDGTPMRNGVPDIRMNDAGNGFRQEGGSFPGSSTQWPSSLNIGATWDEDAAMEWGVAMGTEFAGKGANVLLGPGMCVARFPRNGRNFEYASGEDPYLGYIMVQPVFKGIQSMGVMANGKHWVNNNQEINRTSNNAIVDERTRYEIYYPPFEGAIKANIASIMCSYNLINGEWSCENPTTLQKDLKDTLGFKGWVMSDWGATHSASINAGLDQEMPAARFFNPTAAADALGTAIKNGNVSVDRVNDAVLRVLGPMLSLGIFDNENPVKATSDSVNVSSAAHSFLARKLARRSMVLLKNDNNMLPFTDEVNTIAIIGSQAWSRDAPNKMPTTGGQGSGSVVPPYISTPVDAILGRFGQSVGLNASCVSPKTPRSQCEWTFNTSTKVCGEPTHPGYDFNGNDLKLPAPTVGSAAECCALCSSYDTGGKRCVAYSYTSNGGACYLKSKMDLDQIIPMGGKISSSLGSPVGPEKHIIYDAGTDPERAAATAAKADAAIIFVATNSGEGHDRENLNLDVIPYSTGGRTQNGTSDFLIEQVAATTSKVIVVMVHPGAVLTPWRNSVSGIVAAFLPGQEYGNAVTELLWGDVAPSARLPITMPNAEPEVDLKFTPEQYPGIPRPFPSADKGWVTDTTYSEKLEVGYRYYDAQNVEPAFAFGHGLTFTTFSYSNLKASSNVVTFTVKNTGSRAGEEVAQLYLGFPSSAGEPPKQLKGFKRLALAQGESADVVLALNDRSLSIWDVDSHTWKVQQGSFTAMVGTSSRDIRLTSTFTVEASSR